MLTTNIKVHGTIDTIGSKVSKQGNPYCLCKFVTDDDDRVTATVDDDLDLQEGDTGVATIEITLARFTSAKIVKFMPD